ncbi:MAG: amidohydrolase [Gammaproteobacteria bacterium]|jgi:amidohydrolase|nr:amidohydrolase [Gammaproteobacteria bacterium]MBU0773414.1 amidohydrolase [Gammaproteobacteria bacterium]MBU0857382.1 amidohydrolase [Gammaproteobacteria bacterium]MBU1846845.1 amidohydrolase [Gammaproteobacteria bacterium]
MTRAASGTTHPLIEALAGRVARWTQLRRDLHAHPELAFEETRTGAVVARALREAGIEVHEGIGRTGVVGVLRAGSGDGAIGLRADMDALPMSEQNTFEHCSRHEGRMHGCGHDGHTAMLLAAAEYLAVTRGFDGTVYFIFQPAEEGRGGAPAMIADGLFERFPMQAVFGLHNWPGLPAGQMAVHDGPAMASSDELEIIIEGRGAHAAMPHLGADPVLAGAAIVQSLQSIVSRNVSPVECGVVSVTQFQAGEAYNVIPQSARLRGTARAFTPEVRDQLEAGIERVVQGVAAAHDVSAALNYRRGYPPTINSSVEADFCATVGREVLGEGAVHTDYPPSMGAEDFAYMLQHKPGCYIWLGNGGGPDGASQPGHEHGGGCMLHNPRYDFNDGIIAFGVAYWTRLVERYLARS